jgi:hypothetical protein
MRPDPQINGGPISPPFIFGLQRRPGLAGQQPEIECYSLRSGVARQIVVVLMSQQAHQICGERRCRFPQFRKADAWIIEIVCSSCNALATQRERAQDN